MIIRHTLEHEQQQSDYTLDSIIQYCFWGTPLELNINNHYLTRHITVYIPTTTKSRSKAGDFA
jgi:hypothetical protein